MCFLGFPFSVVASTCPIFHPWATLTIKPFVWNLFCFTRTNPFKCRSLSIISIPVTNLMSMTWQYRGLKVWLSTDSLPVWWQQDRTNETRMLTSQLIGWRTKVLQWVAWLVKCACHSGGLVILDPSAYGFYMRRRALGRDWWTGMPCATDTFPTVSPGCCWFFLLFQDHIFCNASLQLRWLS